MKRVAVFIAFGFFMCLLISSCGTKFSAEIKRVDSLLLVNARADSSLLKIDTAQTHKIAEEVKMNLTFLQKNYKDTITKEMAEFLDVYSSILTSLESVNKQHSELAKELTYSKEQLSNMRQDLEHNIIKKEQVKEYMEREEESVKRNVTSVSVLVEVERNSSEAFDKSNLGVRELVKKVKAKQTEETNSTHDLH